MMNVRTNRAILLLAIASICIYGFLVFIDVIDYGEANAELTHDVDIEVSEPKITFDLEVVDSNDFWANYDPYPTDITLFSLNDRRELTIKLGGDHELVCSGTKKEFYEIMYSCMSGKEPNKPVTLRFKKSSEPEPNEPKEEYVKCSHKRLEMIDNWLFVATSFGEGSLITGKYKCLDCDYEITIVNAVASKPNEPDPKEPDLSDYSAVNWVEAVERWPDAIGYITDNFGRTTPISYQSLPEPNEPELWVDGKKWNLFPIAYPNWEYTICSECGKEVHITESHYCLSQFIPTWPNYIELPKDLWIIDDTKKHGLRICLIEGTKIYFRD